MKKNILCILFGIMVALFNSCNVPGLQAMYLGFENKSNFCVKYITPLEPPSPNPSIVTVYPDTTLPNHWDFKKEVCSGNTVTIMDLHNTSFDIIFKNYSADTLSFFVLDSKLVDSLEWDSIVEKYLVIQRYDLSLNDADWIDVLVFPPDSTMKHIHMWPPYGTYDENGNVIEGRNNKRKTTFTFIP